MEKILATPRSFGKADRSPIALLEEAGYEVVLNPVGRILTQEEMKLHIADAAGIIVGVDPLNAEVLACAGRLRAISKYGVGTDNIDLARAQALGIPVSTTVGANADAVADYAFALMTACARRLVEIDGRCRRRDWGKITALDLYGKTLGILGLGAIGKGVARRAQGFGMTVLAYDVYWDEAYAAENHIRRAGPEEILRACDFVSIHLPLTGETRGMIGWEQLRAMKPTAVLVNTARGGIVDERALVRALREGEIYAAGVDAFSQEPPEDPELYGLDNLIMGSHCAASTVGAVEQMGLMAAQNLLKALSAGLPCRAQKRAGTV
ncbi:2-hydroxyacid dehydrogenase [Oscillospiraceae bacterium]|nr:2-hydroxyacid dehydrogenase [Oscillospiraceae bacterium]BDF76249.1 2-hydroxyacid dehydrogenase [Oscillospiraceae bacterium]